MGLVCDKLIWTMDFVASESGQAQNTKARNSFVVSEVGGGLCTLVSDCLHVVELPLALIPFTVEKGMVLTFDIFRNAKEETNRQNFFKTVQTDLLKSSEA